MDANEGDRISIDPIKVGQPRRTGVVEKVSRGMSGPRYTVRWDDGHATTFNPGAGVLTVEQRARGKNTKASTGRRSTSRSRSGTKKR